MCHVPLIFLLNLSDIIVSININFLFYYYFSGISFYRFAILRLKKRFLMYMPHTLFVIYYHDLVVLKFIPELGKSHFGRVTSRVTSHLSRVRIESRVIEKFCGRVTSRVTSHLCRVTSRVTSHCCS